jgi:hypothetical protein
MMDISISASSFSTSGWSFDVPGIRALWTPISPQLGRSMKWPNKRGSIQYTTFLLTVNEMPAEFASWRCDAQNCE